MGTKRPYSSVDGQGGGHHKHGPSKKKPKQGRKDPGAEDASINAMKTRARTIQRRLQKQSGDEKPMPANVQKDLERELVALKQRIQEAQYKRLRSNMIGKYHMVRFFERKKAQRLVKKLQKELDEAKDPDEIAKLQKDLHIAQVDVNYAIYFPFLEQYVSLYPPSAKASKETGDTPAAELALHAERPPMWATVEEAMEQGERALIRLQNRRPEPRGESKGRTQKLPAETASATGESKPGPAKAKKKEAADGKGRKKAKEPSKVRSDNDESGGESDGGFFEMA
ncbi:rRNA-processing protein EFG1 [Magnaporthiopsis poae ATCC 64411]|uniref:rRNA-processing protein EFG1 n=1 Tax=Magnaporthiopsis poae (strain ATCC 64411 / 73-15) TaxID=644358 RepID=A0A0C4E239_MAGP6|nr:rRNA-processing protein EFG1 [Magnaporthiopsis poae ATCC 64411]